jgi:RNA polymerase sigma-70 factor (ECF subfamily)
VTDAGPARLDPSREAELVQVAKADHGAFGPLFEAYYESVLTYIYRCTMNLAVAEDLTSSTFFKALRGLEKMRPGVPFRPWLYGIATNEIRMHWRSRKRSRTKAVSPTCLEGLGSVCFGPAGLESQEDRDEAMRAYARLHDHLAHLPERYRSVLMLRYFEGLQYTEISLVLGKRMVTVRSLLHRALGRLRTVLEDDATFCRPRHIDR